MTIKRVTQEQLDTWVEALIQAGKVYGVQAKGDHFAFDPLARAADLRLDYDVTILPPKKYFQPQVETLFTFDRKGSFEPVYDEEPFALLGVHPYDMVAISQMDQVFAMNHADRHYLTRRKNAMIVVSDVQRPSKEVFAGCMGNASVGDRNGFDVLLTKLEDGSYVMDGRTEKGVASVESIEHAHPADPDSLKQREEIWAQNQKELRQHELKTPPEDLPELMDRSYDHPVWAEKAELCYSCGSCNLVCPTCYCFNVQDEMNWDMETGRRFRKWDGCMLSGFALVAGNHNFRGNKTDRYRHRYYRKAKYLWDELEEVSCVGCGRCITACTANIANPVEIFNRLLETS